MEQPTQSEKSTSEREISPYNLLEDALITIEVGLRAARQALRRILAEQPQDHEPGSSPE